MESVEQPSDPAAFQLQKEEEYKAMITAEKKKSGPVRGCLIPLLSVVGFLALCFVFCFVLFTLNKAVAPSAGGTGFIMPFWLF